MRKQQSGFTLIELVIVIILLGIIAATVTPQFANIQDNARQAVVDAGGGALQSTALIAFAANNGTAATSAAILTSTDGVGAGGPVVTAAGSCTFALNHIDDAGITGTATVSSDLCTP